MEMTATVGTVQDDRSILSKSIRMSKRRVTHSKSLDIYAESRQQSMHDEFQFEILEMASASSRTLNPDEYAKAENLYDPGGPGDKIHTFNSTEEQLVLKKHALNRKTSQWARLPNSILNLVDTATSMFQKDFGDRTGAPILVIGHAPFAAGMKGHRTTSPKKIISYLAKFFCVFVINEHNTSKCCDGCHCKMEKVKEKGSRRWYCTNIKCKMKDKVVNKDTSACFNMLFLFSVYVATGERHRAYMPASWANRGMNQSR